VFLSFQLETTSRATEVAAVLEQLQRGGMKGSDISDDEMAKSHARYMVGGASDVPNERIFRFRETLSLLDRSTLPTLTFLPAPSLMNSHAQLPFFSITVTLAEFPERPGALRKFLSSLPNMGWNISLFHYRNQGSGKQCHF
jgi:threonine dehydratase